MKVRLDVMYLVSVIGALKGGSLWEGSSDRDLSLKNDCTFFMQECS